MRTPMATVTEPRAGIRARAGVLGVAAVALGVAAHGGAGGDLAAGAVAAPFLLTALLAGPAVVLAALAVAERRGGFGPLPVLALLASVQGGLHLILEVLGAPHSAVHATHHATHHGVTVAVAEPGPDPWLMLAAHGAVTLVVAAALVGADRALLAVLAAHARTVPSAIRDLCTPLSGRSPVPTPTPSPVAAATPAPRESTGVRTVRTHPRRGPPGPTGTTSVPNPRPEGVLACPFPDRRAPSSA